MPPNRKDAADGAGIRADTILLRQFWVRPIDRTDTVRSAIQDRYAAQGREVQGWLDGLPPDEGLGPCPDLLRCSKRREKHWREE